MKVDKSIQTARNNLVISSVLLCITGLVFMIFSETMVNMLGWILGTILCIIGVIQLIGYIWSRTSPMTLLISIVSLVVGVLLFAHPGWVMTFLSVIIGIYILIEAVLKIKVVVEAQKQKVKGWWILLLVALIGIALGILLIVNPFGISKAFMFVLGVAFFINGIQDLIQAIYTKKILNEMSQEIIDMEDYIEK